MTAVPVTGAVATVLGRKDSRDWKAWSPVLREGADGEVITTRDDYPVRVVAGIFSAQMEPGVAVIEDPDGKQYTVTVPDVAADLWELIATAVAFPPDTSAQALASAVNTFLDENPVVTMQTEGLVDAGASGKDIVLAETPADVLDVVEASTSGRAVLTGSPAVSRATLGAGPTVSAADFNVVGDGTANDTTALQAAFTAVPDGGTLKIPRGRYKVTSTLTASGKSFSLDAKHAVFVQSADVHVMTITGGFETIYNVSSVVQSADAGTTGPLLALTLSTGPAWVRGDVVKLVADDEIPGARPTNDTTKARVGQFFTVDSVSGTTVVVAGRLHDPFTTNIRVARLKKCNVNIDGLRIESDNPAAYTQFGLRLVALNAPTVNVSYGQMPSTATKVASCYRAEVSVVIDGGNSDPDTNQVTHGLLDTSGECGVYSVNAGRVRHGFDAQSDAITAGSTDFSKYGRSQGHTVRGIVHGSHGAAWATHSGSQNVTFANTKSIDCYGDFSLRGRYHRIAGGESSGSGYGPNLFDESRLGQDSPSLGHVIDDLILRDGKTILCTANVEDATAPGYGQRVAAPSRLRNVLMTGITGVAVKATNYKLIVEGLTIEGAATRTDATSAIELTNSEFEFTGLTLDYRANTAGASMQAISTLTSSIVRGRGLRWNFLSGTESRILRVIGGTSGTTWDIDDAQLSYNVTVSPSWFSSASGARYSQVDISEGRDNSFYTGTGTAIDANFSYVLGLSKRAVVYGRVDPSGADRVMAKLERGAFRGQRLVLTHTGTANTVTMNDSTGTYRTVNLGGNAAVLNAGQSGLWVWDGNYWRQEDNTSVITTSAAAKSTPDDADVLTLLDSAAGWLAKKLSFTDLKIWLAALTATWANKTLIAPVITGTGQIASGGDLRSYNVGDLAATNYEHGRSYWSGNIYILETSAGGTGTNRSLSMRAGGVTSSITLATSGTRVTTRGDSSASTGNSLGVTGALSATSGTQRSLLVTPVMTQTSTAGYTAIGVDVTETTTGSGTKRLLDLAVGGASKFYVDNAGNTFLANVASPPATPTGGGVLYVESGALKFKGSSGTVTTIAPA